MSKKIIVRILAQAFVKTADIYKVLLKLKFSNSVVKL